MLCALCRKDAILCNSHIIPEFMYRAVYDEKHRFNALSVRPDEDSSIAQKGIRERLFCGACEQLLGVHERYASQLLAGGSLPITWRRDGNLLFLGGIDYKKFKLFQLSILWRAGVSTDPFFERVQLGPHEEHLRVMLLNQDPGDFDYYPCLMWGITLERGKVAGLVIQPSRYRALERPMYQFVFGGFVWVFFVSSQPLSSKYSNFVLQENGSFVMQVRSAMELPTLHNFMQEFDRLGRKPKLDPGA